MTCTFFGHRDTPDAVRPVLRNALENLITRDGVDDFLVGYQGNFDRIAVSELRKLQKEYPHIRYAVVLASLPQEPLSFDQPTETVYPEGLETVPPRFAIARRNDWMLKQAQIVITYVTHSTGGAATYKAKAEKQKKRIILGGAATVTHLGLRPLSCKKSPFGVSVGHRRGILIWILG